MKMSKVLIRMTTRCHTKIPMTERKLYFLLDDGHTSWPMVDHFSRRHWKQYYPAEWGLSKISYYKRKHKYVSIIIMFTLLNLNIYMSASVLVKLPNENCKGS